MKRVGKLWAALAWLVLPSVFGGLVVVWLMRSYLTTVVEVTIVADRVRFVIAGEKSVPVLDSQPFRSAHVTDFSRLSLSPAGLERADPSAAMGMLDEIPADAWRRWDPAPEVIITALRPDLLPAVTIEPVSESERGSVKLIRAGPNTVVVFESTGGGKALYLGLALKGTGAVARLDPGPRAYVLVDNAQVSGLDLPDAGGSEILRITRSPASPLLSVLGAQEALSLNLETDTERAGESFASEAIPVTKIAFERQGSAGQPVSTLIANGKIRYPEYPAVKTRSIPVDHFLRLEPAVAFQILTLKTARVAGKPGISMQIVGEASTVRSGTPKPEAEARHIVSDYRLSLFDVLWNDPSLTALFGMVVWIFGTTVGAWKLWKEIHA